MIAVRLTMALLAAAAVVGAAGILTADTRGGLIALALVGLAWLARDFARTGEVRAVYRDGDHVCAWIYGGNTQRQAVVGRCRCGAEESAPITVTVTVAPPLALTAGPVAKEAAA